MYITSPARRLLNKYNKLAVSDNRVDLFNNKWETACVKSVQELLVKHMPNFETAVPLGPDYITMSRDDVQLNLAHHRLCKKFEVPSEGNALARKEKSLRDVITADTESAVKNLFFNANLCSPHVKWVLYQARELLQNVFKTIHIKNRFIMPQNTTLVDLGDNLSFINKLRTKECWTVTYPCLNAFLRICYNNRALYLAAKHHIGAVSPTERKYLYEKYKDRTDLGFQCFRELMVKYVLTIVPGGRATTVPKNNNVDRVIIIEPLGNMVVQRSLALDIIDAVEGTPLELNIQQAQELHGLLLQDPDNCTVDFANASNSNYVAPLKFMWPARIFSLLDNARSHQIVVNEEEGEYWVPSMFSAMGNGFTFEVMTFTLLAMARTLDSMASVFGDDVIISCDVVHHFIECANNIGFNVNSSKTFTHGPFRESCGYFTYNGEYLKSYEFKYPETLLDATVCYNKLIDLNASLGCDKLDVLISALNRVLPFFCRGPDVGDIGCGYFVRSTFKRWSRNNSAYRHLYDAYDNFIKDACVEYYNLDVSPLIKVIRTNVRDELPLDNVGPLVYATRMYKKPKASGGPSFRTLTILPKVQSTLDENSRSTRDKLVVAMTDGFRVF